MTEIVQVLGANKTGTSTMVAILNSHPDIFVLFECFLDERGPHKGNKIYEFFKKTPKDLRVQIGDSVNIMKNKLCQTFPKKYRYIGDKNPMIGTFSDIDRRLKEYSEHKIIFTVRDIKTWLAHTYTRTFYGAEKDIVSPAVHYIYYLMKAREEKNCLVVRMEDLFCNPEDVLLSIGKHLDVKHEPMRNWWETLENTGDKTKDKMIKWWNAHNSSKVSPKKHDISVEINNNKIWNNIIPLFNKYYYNQKNCLDDDIEKLKYLLKTDPIPFRDCYEDARYIDVVSGTRIDVNKKIKRIKKKWKIC